MPKILDTVSVALATGLYSSYIPATLFRRYAKKQGKWTGAGFVGTLVGAAFLPCVPEGGAGFLVFFAVALAVSAAVSTRAEHVFGRHDDSRIVIDEVVGYWAATAWVPREAAWLTAAFVLFRILDAHKPGPVQSLEKLPGGLGVVMDDVGAGVTANLIIQACLRFF